MKKIFSIFALVSLLTGLTLEPAGIWAIKGEGMKEIKGEIEKEIPSLSKKEGEGTSTKKERGKETFSTSSTSKKEAEAVAPVVKDIAPEFKFVQPSSGEKLKGKVKIKGKVKDADSVEIYYQVSEAILPVYLGKAQLKEDVWEYDWDTNLTPNGSYEVFAKITNQYGKYESSKIKLEVKNESPKNKEKEKKLKEEIEKTEQEIKKEENEIEKKKKEVKEKAVKKLEEITEKVVLPKIEEDKEKNKEEIKKNVEEFTKKEKGEEKEKVKKAIVEKTEEAIKPVEEILLPEERSNLKKEIKEEITNSLKELEENPEKKEEIKEKLTKKVEEIHKEVVLPKINEKNGKAKEKIKEKVEKLAKKLKENEEIEKKIEKKKKEKKELETKIENIKSETEKGVNFAWKSVAPSAAKPEKTKAEKEKVTIPATPTVPVTPAPPATPATTTPPPPPTTPASLIVNQIQNENLESHQVAKANTEKVLGDLVDEKDQNEKEIKETENDVLETIDEVIKPVKEKISPEKKEVPKKEVAGLLEDLKKKIKEKEEIKIEKKQILLKDSDGDGLSDKEEITIGTDPFNPDSDNDGFLDGDEYVAGFNPLKPGPAGKIVYQSPKNVLPQKADVYKVEGVKMVSLTKKEKGLKFSGTGLPNSFVTLFIFSKPIVVAVKTDSSGHWEYTLDKPLSDGEHVAYATLTDNQGQIKARSETFVFVKKGENVFRVFETPAEAASPVKTLKGPFTILVLSTIILCLAIALVIIDILARKKRNV